MACMTLLASPMAMATTQFARAFRYEESAPWPEQYTGRQPLRMSWVVVTGKNRSRVLRMQRAEDEDN
jgi:hypothetical protein